MGNRQSPLQQLAIAAIEVSVLTVHGIVQAGVAVDQPEQRSALLERLERQQYMLQEHAPQLPNIWHGLLCALLTLVKPVFEGRCVAVPGLAEICSLLGHVPEGAGFAESDVATQILQIVVQMLSLSRGTTKLSQEDRLARQTAIVSSVLVVHNKLIEICEDLEDEEYVALQRLFQRIFAVYCASSTTDRFSSAARQSAAESNARRARQSAKYGTMNTPPRARRQGRSTFLSLPGRFTGIL